MLQVNFSGLQLRPVGVSRPASRLQGCVKVGPVACDVIAIAVKREGGLQLAADDENGERFENLFLGSNVSEAFQTALIEEYADTYAVFVTPREA